MVPRTAFGAKRDAGGEAPLGMDCVRRSLAPRRGRRRGADRVLVSPAQSGARINTMQRARCRRQSALIRRQIGGVGRVRRLRIAPGPVASDGDELFNRSTSGGCAARLHGASIVALAPTAQPLQQHRPSTRRSVAADSIRVRNLYTQSLQCG
jgi:hypothetical protein